MATEETTITELELAEEVLADMVIPVDTSTDTKSVSLKQLRAWLGSSLPTGFILPAVGRIDDERFSLLDGKTLSKQGTYGAFYTKVEEQVQGGNWFACSEEEYNADLLAYGQCGKFVIGTDYVRIPTITRFIGATITLSEIGKTYKESLPNIKGSFGGADLGGGSEYNEGAFYNGTEKKGSTDSGSGTADNFIKYFDASRSSSTYQNGAKVQPDHTKYPYYMVISTEGQTASVEIDINKVYEDMNLKATTDLSNVSSVASSFKEQSVGWGMPDYSAGVNLGEPTNYQVLPCDCYVTYSADTGNSVDSAGFYYANSDESFIGEFRQALTFNRKGIGLFLSKGWKVKRWGNYSTIIYYPLKGVN